MAPKGVRLIPTLYKRGSKAGGHGLAVRSKLPHMDADTQIGGENARFPDTRHSAIAAACGDDDDRRTSGFDVLIAAYWKPVYRYIRVKWRRSNEDAKDLTQSFFAAVIEKNFFHSYDAGKGTFRTFLRVCLDRFLANDHKFEGRRKRSAEFVVMDLDATAAGESADDIFRREWERCLFEDAVEDLRESLRARGRGVCFEVFERYDLAEEPASYERLAREFDISTSAVTNYLAAARRELRRLVLDRLRSATTGDREFRREARALFR
jgi:RNA polymerase sigma factor (sigma-70 family)